MGILSTFSKYYKSSSKMTIFDDDDFTVKVGYSNYFPVKYSFVKLFRFYFYFYLSLLVISASIALINSNFGFEMFFILLTVGWLPYYIDDDFYQEARGKFWNLEFNLYSNTSLRGENSDIPNIQCRGNKLFLNIDKLTEKREVRRYKYRERLNEIEKSEGFIGLVLNGKEVKIPTPLQKFEEAYFKIIQSVSIYYDN